MDIINLQYRKCAKRKSDINEHISTLREYASKCESVFETGVRSVCSSWAFAKGLMENNSETKDYLINDIYSFPRQIVDVSAKAGINIEMKIVNNLELKFEREYDLTFIDTWHVYKQLANELDAFSPITKKYIILHDTTTFGENSEYCLINNYKELFDYESDMIVKSGYSEEDCKKGLWLAVEEFLEKNKEWELEKRFTNNNGLTILRRKEI